MLKFFRKKNVAKMVFWGLIILILPGFVLYGVYSASSKGKGPAFVGLIDGNKISFEDFGKSIGSIRCQILLNYFNQPQMAENFLKNRPFVAKVAWDRLIMLREAQKQRVKAADDEVRGFIRSHPLFLKDGKFDDKTYAHILRYSFGLEPRSFEEIVRDSIIIRKMGDAMAKDVSITDDEVARAYQEESGKFKLAYVMVDPKDFLDKVSVDDEEVKQYYENNKAGMMFTPQGQDKSAARQASFEEAKDTIRKLLTEAKARRSAFTDAQESYKKIADLMAEKQSFEAAAQKLGLKVSETPLFSRTDYLEGMGEAALLAAVAASLDIGQAAGPIETRGGIAIVKLSEIEKPDQEKFAKEKDDFARAVLERKRGRFVEDWLREVEKTTTLNVRLDDIDKYFR
ncbi:MAG: SurA N-terminal domain-containing protein [Candidatus Omnitrophica bacterium]|nr:SurA N-terminal domain-containing protein [Candidatus Omnitrophota bacterium]